MAQVNSSNIFPSIRSISTDSVGDLQEITSSPEAKASRSVYASDSVTLTARNAGIAGNDISLEVVDDTGLNSGNNVVVTGNKIKVCFSDAFASATGGTKSFVNYNNAFDVSDLDDGASTVQFSVVDNVVNASGNDEVKVSATDSDISVCLSNDATTYTNADIHDLLTDNTRSWYNDINAVVTIGSLSSGGDPIETGVFDLVGGADPVGQTATKSDIVTLINGNPSASALVVASGGGASLPSIVAEINLENGNDAIFADLAPQSDYLMIKVSDIHSLLPSEVGDGRKIFWGVLESYAQYVLGLSAESKPENLVLTRGNPTLVIDSAGTRIRQSYSIQSFYATGDFDLEDETSV
jgi:hypothetical protein